MSSAGIGAPTPFDTLGATLSCQCGYGDLCVCPLKEAAMRAYASGSRTPLPAMNSEQRDWCLEEIGSVEGHDRKDHDYSTDQHLARAVLNAWTDYARDKGLY
ncbi:hypothetical protein [Microvirga tunisiensis]|uniref:Uncharacterized protein n=1 Tax=Microvirga tunisiensis TaxID=2108360 RepID=A0A5N7MMX6_9HYPH|nr:hypothetical protein [Microvirga tunisiensis]MPR10151.1 hypothetical protein [Microvirga tunisiensis]MPR28357.1 hypothetical protein [Microvirga tunisiensis]